MDAEHRVLCAVLAQGTTRELTDAQITAEHFPTPVHRRLYHAILSHQARYGVVPAPESLKERFPDYAFETPPEPTAVYLDALRANRERAVLEAGLLIAVEALEAGKLEETKDSLGGMLRSLVVLRKARGQLDLASTVPARIEQYRSYGRAVGLRGIPTGFATIDRATLGLQPGQLIVIGGLPKGGKSTVLAALTRHAHADAYANGAELVPLVYTIEMGEYEFAERLDAQIAGVDLHKLRAGELNQAELLKLERALGVLSAMPSIHIVKGIAQQATVTDIAAHVERHRPDLLCVDGVYLMRDELTGDVGTPQALTSLTQSFKALADTWQIPVVITSQLLRSKVDRKRGADGGSFGWSSSFEMDADVAIVLDETESEQYKKLKIVASRNSANVTAYLQWDWSTATFREIEGDPFASAAAGHDAARW